MIPPRRIPAAAYAAAIFAVNFWICRELFFVEFTGHMNSLQGLWISMARLAGEHWFRPAWWPYQDAGVPFEHVYAPLVPAASALVAWIAHCSPARAFHIVMGLVCCLGPVTLFVMAWKMSGAPGRAFAAALLYSLTSPARALIPEQDFNPVRFWSSQRIYTTIVWDDLPHQAAVCLLPLALLFLWRSFGQRRPLDRAAAVISMAATALASMFGATALALGAACMLAALPRHDLRRNLRLLAVRGFMAWLLASPFLPPSLLAAIRSNQQRFVEDQWSAGSFTALSLTILGCVLIARALERRGCERHVRFFVLFAFVAAVVPLLDAYLKRHFLPQPNRYHFEMELALAPAIVLAATSLLRRLPRNLRLALGAFLLCLAADQAAALRRATELITRPVDSARGIEYRLAQWFDREMPGQRVMVPGSIAQWLNVFSDAPQLSGASFSTSPNWTQQEAMTSILTAVSPAELETAVLWLKAFGVQAATACGPKSPEFWKGQSSTRFEKLLPVLWQGEDTVIYRVPQRSASLAHVIPAPAAARRHEARPLPAGELRKYVEALDDPSLPLAGWRWNGFRGASIDAVVQPGQLVSVQTTYHPGWRAAANGRPAEVRRDGLGLLLIEPACEGTCRIELTYDGGWEYRFCRWLSLFAAGGLIVYAAAMAWRSRPASRSG